MREMGFQEDCPECGAEAADTGNFVYEDHMTFFGPRGLPVGLKYRCENCGNRFERTFDGEKVEPETPVEFNKCPNCGEVYEPEFVDPQDAPEGSIYREQHQTGICSNECWDEFVGGGGSQ